ncbi:hypothetical protein C5706_32965, partial [Klebsiella pneumoniae]
IDAQTYVAVHRSMLIFSGSLPATRLAVQDMDPLMMLRRTCCTSIDAQTYVAVHRSMLIFSGSLPATRLAVQDMDPL